MQDNTPISLPAAQVFPKCAGMGFLWLCVSALIVFPLLFSIFFLYTFPSRQEWAALDNPEISYASLLSLGLSTGFFVSLVSYFPWLLVTYGLGLCCSRFWLRVLWAVLLVACGGGLFVFLLWVPMSCSLTVGPAVLACLVPILFIYEAICLLSYLLPYWLSCRRAARR